MAINLTDNIKVNAPKPSDPRYFALSNIPWSSVSNVNATIPLTERHIGLTVNINNVEYWYKDGVTNIDLVVKVDFTYVSQSLETLSQSYNNVYASQSNYLPTSSYLADSSSFDNRVLNIHTSQSLYTTTQSFTNYSASVAVEVSRVYASQSSYTPTQSFNTFTQSYYSDSASFDARFSSASAISSGFVTTQSFNNYTSSNEVYITNVYASQSLYTPLTTFNTYTSSVDTLTTNILFSQSNYLPTASYLVDSGSFNLRINNTFASQSNYITLTSLSSVATGLTYTNTTGVFSLTSGYLIPTTASYNNTNWDNAFTNRITSLTTTGSSGAATLVSNVLNIPTYTLTGLGGVPDTRTVAGFPLSSNVTLANLTATDATLTFSGTYNGSTARTIGINLSNANTWTGQQSFNPTVTANGAIARSQIITGTLLAAANNDVLIGLDINPTFTNGVFTGITNYAARITGQVYVISNTIGNSATNAAIGTSGGIYANQYSVFNGGIRANNGYNNAGFVANILNTSSSNSLAIGINSLNITSTIAAASGTTPYMGGISIDSMSISGGTTVTNVYGAFINNQTLGTNNTLLALVSYSTGNWSIYNAGTYNNYFASKLLINTIVDAGYTAFDFNGTGRVTGLTTFETGLKTGTTGLGGGNIEVNGTLSGGYNTTLTANAAPTIQQNVTSSGSGLSSTMLTLTQSLRAASTANTGTTVFTANTNHQQGRANTNTHGGVGAFLNNNSSNNILYYTSFVGFMQTNGNAGSTVTNYTVLSNASPFIPTINSAVTNHTGIDFSVLPTGTGTTATNFYGFRFGNSTTTGLIRALDLSVASGSNKWNIYAGGTASNYLAGKLLIGTNVDAGYTAFDFNGTGRISGAFTVVTGDTTLSNNNAGSIYQLTVSGLQSSGSQANIRLTDLGGRILVIGTSRNSFDSTSTTVPFIGVQDGTILLLRSSQTGSSSSVMLQSYSTTGNIGSVLIPSGYLGIGTATPTSVLHLAGNRSASSWGVNGIQSNHAAATYTDTSTAASGTVAVNAVNSFGIPTLTATNTNVTNTIAANVYIAGAPAQTGTTVNTNSYSLYVAAGASLFNGVILANNTISSTSDIVANRYFLNAGTSAVSAYSANGQIISLPLGRTINSTVGSGTVPISTTALLSSVTYSANIATTFTTHSTLQIGGPPIAGTNVTITNPLSLYVGTGTSAFGGKILVNTLVDAGFTGADINGTVRIQQALTMAADILPSTNTNFSLGGLTQSWNTIWGANVRAITDLTLRWGVASNLSFNNSTQIVGTMFNTTGNLLLQNGGIFTDNGFRLDVNGTGRFQNTLTATKYQLSALNTAPSSSSDTGAAGEIRWVNGFVYLCVATNTWQRAALSTF